MLTPLSLDAAHPFPYVSNLSTSWAFRLEDPVSGESVLVRVKVPSELPQWLRVRAGRAAAPSASSSASTQVIAANAEKLFPGMVIDEREPVPGLPRRRGRARRRRAASKRALVERGAAAAALRAGRPARGAAGRRPGDGGRARGALRARRRTTSTRCRALLDYTTLFEIAGLDDRAAARPAVDAAAADRPRGGRRRHLRRDPRAATSCSTSPYDSFYASVERFIREAADDPLTVSIKMTVYRVGDDTPFVQSLIRAAEAGQAGRLRDRAERPLRRGAQPALVARAGEGRRPRRVRRDAG